MDGLTGGELHAKSLKADENTVVNVPGAGSHINVPGSEAFLNAGFIREGYDLTLDAGDAGSVLIPDYFLGETPPDLVIGGTSVIKGDWVVKLAGPMAPGQYAQAQINPDQALGAAIGSVTELEGAVTALRADGTQVALNVGDAVYQGDAIETGAKSSVGVVFADDTTFSLGEDGNMVMDEMVYDPDTQGGVFEATVIKGVFSFVSGQTAKTDPEAMVIHTPKTTIGIRGSTGLIRSGINGGEDIIALIPDIDGNLGELVVATQGGFLVLNLANASTTVISALQPPASVVFLSPQEIQQNYGSALTTLVRTEARKAEVKAEQAAQRADEAEQEAAQQQAEAQQAEADAAEADAEAAAAEAAAAEAAAEAEAAAAEAAAAAAEAEAATDAEAKAAAEAKLAAAEAKVAEAEAKAAAEAEAAAAKSAAAEAKVAEAAVKAEQAALAQQQAAQAVAAEQAAQQFSQVASTAAEVQQQMYTQFVETGQVDPALAQKAAEAARALVISGNEGNGEGEGEIDGPPVDLPPPPPPPPPPSIPLPFFPPPGEIYDPFADYGYYDGPVYDPATDDPFFDPNTVSDFDEHFVGTVGNDALVGTDVNTNFYFTYSALGGTDTVDDPGGANQLSFDLLQNVMLQLTMTGTNTGTFDIRSGYGNYSDAEYSGQATINSISFTGVTQYLFSDISISSAYSSDYSGYDPSGSTTTPEHGDVLVLEGMESSDVGYVIAGNNTADTFDLDHVANGMLVFGRGGGDTFNITTHGSYTSADGADANEHIMIGGIYDASLTDTTANNRDANSDGIPDTEVNIFDYSGLTFSSNTSAGGLNDGTKGLAVYMDGYVGEPGGDAHVSENVTDSDPNDARDESRLNDLLWDVGSFIATGLIDDIHVSSGTYKLIDAGAGDDDIAVTGSDTKLTTLTAGAGNDTIVLSSGATINALQTTSGDNTVTVGSNVTISTLSGGTGDETIDIYAYASVDSIVAGDGINTVSVSQYGDLLGYTGGSSDDSLLMDAAVLAGGGTYNGGAGGTNTLTIHAYDGTAYDFNDATFSNFGTTYTFSGQYSASSGVDITGDASVATTFQGSGYGDVMIGGAGDDSFTGGTGDDTFKGDSGNDTFNVDSGTDTINDLGGASGGESDILIVSSGATANATLNGNYTATAATANNGTVTITSSTSSIGTIDLSLATGANGFTVNNGASTAGSTIIGSTKGDNITASTNGDNITGGAGDDTLVGGGGVDTFIFADTAANNGQDTITSFTGGTDKINLAAFDTVGTTTNVAGATDANAAGEVFYLFLSGTFGVSSVGAESGIASAVNSAATAWTDTAATSVLVISDDDGSAVYEWTGDGNGDGATAAEFTLMGTLDGTITTPADIILA